MSVTNLMKFQRVQDPSSRDRVAGRASILYCNVSRRPTLPSTSTILDSGVARIWRWGVQGGPEAEPLVGASPQKLIAYYGYLAAKLCTILCI